MDIEYQFLTIDQAKNLKGLGLDMSESAFSWVEGFDYPLPKRLIKDLAITNKVITDTMSEQEIMDVLPRVIRAQGKSLYLYYDAYGEYLRYSDSADIEGEEDGSVIFYSDYGDLFGCSYNALEWALKNGHIKR